MGISLEQLNVLFVDCQATGANPEKGRVIEIGWARSDTLEGADVETRGIETFLVSLPKGQGIPRRVEAITGIRQEDLDAGDRGEDVWARLLNTARDLAESNRMERCPAVIHFSRYEEPFLRGLHERFTPVRDFPLQIVCTHEVSRRLFPDLPRRSMRAVAGFLGHSLGEFRRCRDHVEATAFIWRKVVDILRERHQVTTLEALRSWLDDPAFHIQSHREYPMKSSARSGLKDRPGVYRMLRSNGDVLYVGKANSLRKRVNSYFQKKKHPEHVLEMLSQAKELDVTETETAFEAAILESDEIKRLSPPYNVALRARGREVWFCSRDFREFGRSPTRTLGLGPFSSKEPVQRLSDLGRVISRGPRFCEDDLLFRASGLLGDHSSHIERIRAGFDLFLDLHSEILQERPVERALMALGRSLWMERSAEAQKEDEDSDEGESEEEHVLTSESVARWIESLVLRGTHEIRRFRWLVLLTESSLAFRESESSTRHRLLIFEGGRIVGRGALESGEKIPVPSGYGRSFIERQECFDLPTVDRMRVATSEIRRIVNQGREVRLRLTPDAMLNRDRLTRVLKWI
jgi:DNA polymerase-3 subunit epsilon